MAGLNPRYILRKATRTLFPDEVMPYQKRLSVYNAKWKGDANSPVMLMIDDLTNAWMKVSQGENFETRGDWGGLYDSPQSIFSFLEENLFNFFPEIKTTFFAVMGAISQYTFHEFFTFAGAVNENMNSLRFFNKVFSDPRFEIAYHGLHHGKPGKTTKDFVQEWKSFHSLDEAIQIIRKGQEIYKSAFGVMPHGGKYCGWEYNSFSDPSVDEAGFRWWCRDWMPKDISGNVVKEYYEPQYFGKSKVIALPSTIHGRNWTKKQIDRLCEDRQIISIEEHMGAIRPDGLIQTPNAYDDIARLRTLFKYLRQKKVWYAKGSEIADYIDAYINTFVTDIGENSFRIDYAGRKQDNEITLVIQMVGAWQGHKENLMLVCPDGSLIGGHKGDNIGTMVFTLPAQSGIFYLRER